MLFVAEQRFVARESAAAVRARPLGRAEAALGAQLESALRVGFGYFAWRPPQLPSRAQPGGRRATFFVGSDSRTSALFRLLHVADTLVPVAPEGFAARLERAGFHDVKVDVAARSFRFRAGKPA